MALMKRKLAKSGKRTRSHRLTPGGTIESKEGEEKAVYSNRQASPFHHALVTSIERTL